MFSTELLDKLQAEADAAGVRGASNISLAVRSALMERKRVGLVPDGRTQTYWARLEGPDFEGDSVFEGLQAVFTAFLQHTGIAMGTAEEKACRVWLARNAEWRYGATTGHVLTVRNTAP